MVKVTVIQNIKTEFYDGETGNKLLIILATDKTKNIFLCCKVTSKKRYNIENVGCYFNKNIFITNKPPFNIKTWIQFDPNSLFEYSTQYLLQGHFNGNIKIIGEIENQEINTIINCIKKSEDISNYHLKLLSI